jgi:hypothetical protein
MIRSFSARCVGMAVLCTAAVAAMLLVWPTPSPAFAMSDPDPYDLPAGTVVEHVLSMPGYILSATEPDENGRAREADLRALGTPMVDNVYRGSGDIIDWGDRIDLGAFYNAGGATATVVFSSRLIIELEPGQVAFASSELSVTQIADTFVAKGGTCRCKCPCRCGGQDYTITLTCAELGGASECTSLPQGTSCSAGGCSGGQITGVCTLEIVASLVP